MAIIIAKIYNIAGNVHAVQILAFFEGRAVTAKLEIFADIKILALFGSRAFRRECIIFAIQRPGNHTHHQVCM